MDAKNFFAKVVSMSRSLFIRWLLSYILLLLLPIIISTIIYHKGEDIIRNELDNANRAVLEQVRQAIDHGIKNIDHLVCQVGLNSKFQRLARKDLTMQTLDRYLVLDFIKDIKEYKVSSIYVYDIYIYLRNVDRILSMSGLSEPSTYFNVQSHGLGNCSDMSYDQWYEMLNNRHNKDFKTITQVYDGNDCKKTVLHIHSFPFNSGDSVYANIVVSLSSERFQNIVEGIGYVDGNGLSMIIDDDDNVLFANHINPETIWTPTYSMLEGNTGFLCREINGEEYAITYITSQSSKLKYVTLVPSNLFWSKVAYIRKLTMLSVFLCMIVGGIIAFYFARKNYSPVNELVNFLEKRFSFLHGKGYNEYRFIREAMDSTLNENEKIKQRLKQQDSILKSNFLMKLLKGRIEDEGFIKNALSSYNINFNTQRFAVMLFYITDLGDLLEEDAGECAEDKLGLAHFIINNVVEELVSRENQGFMVEIDEMIACLVNFSEHSKAKGKSGILDIAATAVEFIRNKFNIGLIASVSSIHESIYGIPECYQEALNVIEYKLTMENDSILSYDDIKSPKRDYNYPIETEHQLINCIKSGDYEAATTILDKVFENNFSKEPLSLDMVKCMMFDLVGTVLKTLSELSLTGENSVFRDLNVIERLLRCEKIQEMRCQMDSILKEVCLFIRNNRKNERDYLIRKVIEYIHENYYKYSFSVSSMAEKFKITPAYLAKLFREHTNEGLSDYISRVRIEKAKELLKSDGLSIKDIGEKVGYYHSSVFIRAFKKYEGVTPGVFKEMLLRT